MTLILFTAIGEPAPQGSKNQWGGESSKKVAPWRATVAAAAAEAMAGRPAIAKETPVSVRMSFWLKRPKGHFRTGRFADQLKDTAPLFVTTYPDLDKLARATSDALVQGGVLEDDSSIAVSLLRKAYREPGTPSRAEIAVEVLEG